MDERHAVLPIECQPQIANPLSESGHMALLCRSPPQVDDANTAQGQEPGQGSLIVMEDFLVVSSGYAQFGVPIITL